MRYSVPALYTRWYFAIEPPFQIGMWMHPNMDERGKTIKNVLDKRSQLSYYKPMTLKGKVTDTIPRASLHQVFSVLTYLTASETTFDDIRAFLQQKSGRKTPGSREAMWTVARDVLSELQRLGNADVGPLPRERSDLDRLKKSPCRITDKGLNLATLHSENRGRAYDDLLTTWLNEHAYFRALLSRLLRAPLHIPDITS